MASGGAVDSRVVCSVCLEPYKGRQPKLLPCFHTFCLPCLTALEQRASRQQKEVYNPTGEASNGSIEKKDCTPVSIVCPTCRKVIPVPPAGVTEFQSNFYVDDDGDAGLTVAQLQRRSSEDGIDDLLDKLRGQVKVVKSVLAVLTEEESQVESERRRVEQDINVQYAAGLGLLAYARDECFRSLRDVCQAAGDTLKMEITAAHRMEAKLSWFASQDRSNFSKSELQAVMISDSEFGQLQQRADKGKKPQFFSFNPMDKQSASVVNILHSYMGTASLRRENSEAATDQNAGTEEYSTPAVYHSSAPVVSQSSSENPELLNDLMLKVDSLVSKVHTLENMYTAGEKKTALLQTENATLHKKLDTVQDALESRHGRLQSEVMYVRDKNAILCQDVASLQAENVKLCEMVMETRQDSTVQSNIDSIRQELSTVKQANTAINAQIAALQRDTCQFAKMRETVAFKARLTNDVTTNRKEVLVNNFVMLNIGGGYNNQTGVFTAPVSGLYIFMAKVSNAEEEKTAKVDVVLDNNPIAFAVASGTYDSCTCHAVVKVVAGQKVWLRTFSESSSFCGKWGTAFCGVLIKPEL